MRDAWRTALNDIKVLMSQYTFIVIRYLIFSPNKYLFFHCLFGFSAECAHRMTPRRTSLSIFVPENNYFWESWSILKWKQNHKLKYLIDINIKLLFDIFSCILPIVMRRKTNMNIIYLQCFVLGNNLKKYIDKLLGSFSIST